MHAMRPRRGVSGAVGMAMLASVPTPTAPKYLLVKIGDHPHRGQVRDDEQLVARGHDLAGVHAACDDDAVAGTLRGLILPAW